MDSKSTIDQLAQNPAMYLCFNKMWQPKWEQREALTPYPIEGTRERSKDKEKGRSTDYLLILVLKFNPGLGLQLCDNSGKFPYLALHARGFDKLNVPEGMFASDGYLCITIEDNNRPVKLAKILK